MSYARARVAVNDAVGRTVGLSVLGQTPWHRDTLLESAKRPRLSACCVGRSASNWGLQCYLRTLVLQ